VDSSVGNHRFSQHLSVTTSLATPSTATITLCILSTLPIPPQTLGVCSADRTCFHVASLLDSLIANHHWTYRHQHTVCPLSKPKDGHFRLYQRKLRRAATRSHQPTVRASASTRKLPQISDPPICNKVPLEDFSRFGTELQQTYD
jgi:hypothetical protein